MDFAFDPAKSDANLRKHGIDFQAAQVLWRDPALLEIPARTSLVRRDHLPPAGHPSDLRPPLPPRRGAAL